MEKDYLFVEYNSEKQYFHFISFEEMLDKNLEQLAYSQGRRNLDFVPVFYGPHEECMKFTEEMRERFQLPGRASLEQEEQEKDYAD